MIEEMETVKVAIEPTPQQEFSAALRAIASFYDAHPEVEAPDYPNPFIIYNVSKEKLPVYARAFGTLDKVFDEYSLRLVKKFGFGLELQTYSSRESVCERVKIGEEVVPAHVVPAKPAQPATEEVFVEEKTREVFEWKCPGALLAPVGTVEEVEVEEEVADVIPF